MTHEMLCADGSTPRMSDIRMLICDPSILWEDESLPIG